VYCRGAVGARAASCCWYHWASAADPGTRPVVPGTGRLLFFLPAAAIAASCCWYHWASAADPGTRPVVPGTGRERFFLPALCASATW